MNRSPRPNDVGLDRRDALTYRLLVDAGIDEGMRVLDVGCGHGTVSAMVARLVGEHGLVVGLDRDAAPLAVARQKIDELRLGNVAFVQRDLSAALDDLGLFDAAVGRRVLMYVDRPSAVVARIAAALEPGGLVVFEEYDATMVPGRVVAMPLHEQVHAWIWRTVEREGGNLHMGFDLPAVFAAAGLAVGPLRAEAVILTPDMSDPLGAIVRAILPRMLKQGVATEAEIGLDTLEARLLAERHAAASPIVTDMAFGIWGRRP